jgi:hypothetical protein
MGYPLQFLARPDPTVPPPPIFYLGPIRAPLHLVLLKRFGYFNEKIGLSVGLA